MRGPDPIVASLLVCACSPLTPGAPTPAATPADRPVAPARAPSVVPPTPQEPRLDSDAAPTVVYEHAGEGCQVSVTRAPAFVASPGWLAAYALITEPVKHEVEPAPDEFAARERLCPDGCPIGQPTAVAYPRDDAPPQMTAAFVIPRADGSGALALLPDVAHNMFHYHCSPEFEATREGPGHAHVYSVDPREVGVLVDDTDSGPGEAARSRADAEAASDTECSPDEDGCMRACARGERHEVDLIAAPGAAPLLVERRYAGPDGDRLPAERTITLTVSEEAVQLRGCGASADVPLRG